MYIKRLIEKKTTSSLNRNGGVLIEGAKAVGKTEIGKKITKSFIQIDASENEIEALKMNLQKVLEGEKPRCIDEWQIIPQIWNLVRKEIDETQGRNLFVLTGSSSPLLNNQNIHSGAFRIGRVLLSTLTLTEKGTSSKKINFLDLCSENKFSELSHDKFDDIIKEICVGGWPRNIGLSADDSMENVKEYIKNVINFDSQKLSYKVKPILFERFLSSLSRNIAHDVKDATLAKDTNISDETVRNYLNVCSEMYLTKTLHVWNTHIRSSKGMRTKPKVYFLDPSIAVASLGITQAKLSSDYETLGFFFENLVIRDFSVYAQLINAKTFFYADLDNLEIDLILEFEDETWSAFEIKLGSDKGTQEGIKNLKKFFSKLDERKQKLMKSLNVITAKNASYTTEDGINVISFQQIFFEN